VQPEASDQHVQSLARGLAVIRAFDEAHPRMTVSEVAARIDLSRATTRRFLLTLADLGYVATDGRTFQLTPRVLDLGFSYLSALSLPELAQPHLERLSRTLDESTSASVLDGDSIVYVARVPVRRIMSVAITIGTRLPAPITSMGRVLLAATPPSTWPDPLHDVLGTVRAQGWALVDQELEAGIRSVAVPVHSRDGAVVAAINVSSTASSTTVERMTAEFLPALLATAHDIDAAIAHT